MWIGCCVIFEPSSLESVMARKDGKTQSTRCKGVTHWKNGLSCLRNSKHICIVDEYLEEHEKLDKVESDFESEFVFYTTTKSKQLSF
jgi:hypothetical protein